MKGAIFLGSRWLTVFALVAVGGVPSGGAVQVRQDPPSEAYLVGALTWNQGEGGITWFDAPTEDPGGLRGDHLDDVYTSEPITHTIYVNASRLIQIDIYTKRQTGGGDTGHYGTSCYSDSSSTPGMGAELHAGARLLGGIGALIPGETGLHGEFDRAVPFPPNPPGYDVCRLRFPAEIGVLTEGVVLRLHLYGTISQAGWGMAGDHRSVIRIPYFSDEEVPYRFPTYAHGFASGPSAGPGALETLRQILGGVAAAALPLAAPGRAKRTTTATLLALVFLMAGLSGCARGKTGGSGAQDEVVAVPLTAAYQEGDLSSDGLGSIAGQVSTRALSKPIAGANVALLRSPHGGVTDPYGRFLFRDVEPGEYTIHVDHKAYRVFEGTVDVLPNLIARVNITLDSLAPSEPRGPQPRSPGVAGGHPHDYWGGATRKVIMESVELGMVCPGLELRQVFPCTAQRAFSIPEPSGAGVSSIFPGTYDVNITLDWDPGTNTAVQAGLVFQANNDPSFLNQSVLRPRPPGVPFHIATTWEMQDSGHQRFSTWLFQIFDGRSASPCFLVDCPEPSGFIVSIEITKGVVPLEPVHPELWAGRDSKDLIQKASKPATYFVDPFPTSNTYTGVNYGWSAAWFPTGLVPTDTTWLEVTATASRALLPPYDVHLRFHSPKDGAPGVACWTSTTARPCDGGDYLDLGPGVIAGLSARWVVPLKESDADPFYAARSFAVFGLGSAKDEATQAKAFADNTDLLLVGYNNALGGVLDPAMRPLSYELTVVAHRDSPP